MARQSPEIEAKLIKAREGGIEEATGVILSMCRPEALFMACQTIHVSGGL
jgi:hypothetical protein